MTHSQNNSLSTKELISWEQCYDEEVINHSDYKSRLLTPPQWNLPQAHWKYLGRERFQPIFARFFTNEAKIVVKLLEERIFEMAVEFAFKNYSRTQFCEMHENLCPENKTFEEWKAVLLELFTEGHSLIVYDLTHQKVMGLLIARLQKTGVNPYPSAPEAKKSTLQKFKKNKHHKDLLTNGSLIKDKSTFVVNNPLHKQKQGKLGIPENKLNVSSSHVKTKRHRDKIMVGNITHNTKIFKFVSSDFNHNKMENPRKQAHKINKPNDRNKWQNYDGLTSQNGKLGVYSNHENTQKDGNGRPKTDIYDLESREISDKNTNFTNAYSHNRNNSEISKNYIFNENFEVIHSLNKYDGKRKVSNIIHNVGYLGHDGNNKEQKKQSNISNSNKNKAHLNLAVKKSSNLNVKSNLKEEKKRNIADQDEKHNIIKGKNRSFDKKENRQNNGKEKYSSQHLSEMNKRRHTFDALLMKSPDIFSQVQLQSVSPKDCYISKHDQIFADLNIKKYFYIHFLCVDQDFKDPEALLYGLVKGIVIWAKFIMTAENIDAVIAVPKVGMHRSMFQRAGYRVITKTNKLQQLDDEDKDMAFEGGSYHDDNDALNELNDEVNEICCYVSITGEHTKNFWNYIGIY